MTPDDEKEVFDYGDRTLFTLRTQSFDVDSDYGTMIGRPAPLLTVEAPLEMPPVAAQTVQDDPIVRLEKKLDAALHAISMLQQKLESIDATLARALNR